MGATIAIIIAGLSGLALVIWLVFRLLRGLARRWRRWRARVNEGKARRRRRKEDEKQLRAGIKKMNEEDKRNPLPHLKVMLLGFRESGKTVQLAATHHSMCIGDDGVRLQPYPPTLAGLGGMVSGVLSGSPALPAGNLRGVTTEWQFRVQAAGDRTGLPRTLFRLSYVDYAGEHGPEVFNKNPSSGGGAAAVHNTGFLLSALENYDIVMGILDGEKVAQVMLGYPPAGFEAELFQTMSLWSQGSRKLGQLVLTKWDLLSHYRLADVIERLDSYEPFRGLRGMARAAPLRLIPVAGLGLNGYLTRTPDGFVKNPGKTWQPFNASMPLACALTDIVTADLQRIEASADPASTVIGVATSPLFRWVLAGLGLAVIAPHALHAIPVMTAHTVAAKAGLTINLKIPLDSVLRTIRELMRDGQQPSRPSARPDRGALRTLLGLPGRPDPEMQSAMAHTVTYCAKQTANLERQFPECIISPPGHR